MKKPFYVKDTDGLMAPMVIMYKHRVNDVPVVNNEQRVVGLVSLARVGSIFLRQWLANQPTQE